MGCYIKLILPIALTVVMLLSTVGMTGATVASEDEWPDDCDEAPIIDSGEYSGSIDSPEDVDFFRLQFDKGEYYAVNAIVPKEQDHFFFFSGKQISIGEDVSNVELDSSDYTKIANDYYVDFVKKFQPGVKGSWQMFAEEDGVHCFYVEEGGAGDIPYEWQLSLEKNDPEPAGFEITEVQEKNDELQSEISDLESEISELESQLNEKDERIAELETQLENAEVTIDVSVEPENQASYQVGGSMAVDIDAEGTSASDVMLNYAGEEYTASGGEATIPIDSAGTQQLDINYQDTTETITLDVADQDEDTATDGDSSADGGADDGSTSSDDDGSTTDDDSGTTDDGSTDGSADDDGAGFGIVAALVALSGIGLLSHRQLTSESDQ